jgi:hypothetical protein
MQSGTLGGRDFCLEAKQPSIGASSEQKWLATTNRVQSERNTPSGPMNDDTIDYRAAEAFLRARKSSLIKLGVTLDRKFFEWCSLSGFGAVEIMALFPQSSEKKREQLPYRCELACPTCHIWFNKDFPKSMLRELIGLYKRGPSRRCDLYRFNCAACERKRDEEHAARLANPNAGREALEAWKKREMDEARARTPEFIKTYLVPGIRWNTSIPRHDLYPRLRSAKLDDDMVAEAIRGMPPDAFYNTPYWAAVAAEVVARTKGRCSVCPATEKLNLIYRTMDYFGYEHTEQGIREILCLCPSCERTYVFQRRVGPLTGLN